MKKIHLNKWKHKTSLYLMLFCLSLPLALTPLSVSATEKETESEQTAPTSQKDASNRSDFLNGTPLTKRAAFEPNRRKTWSGIAE